MKNIILTVFVISVIWGCNSSKQEPPFELSLQLKENNGKVPALVAVSMGGRYIFDPEFPGEPADMPEDLQNGEIIHGIIDMPQYLSQGYSRGFIEKSIYDRNRMRIDSATLTDEWVDVIFTIAVGEDAEGKTVAYVENEEGNFGNEPYIFDQDQILFQGQAFEIMKTDIPVGFEFYDGKEVARYEGDASLAYMEGTPPAENMQMLFHKLRMGTWIVNEQTFDVVLAKEGAPPYRNEAYTFLYIDMNRDGQFDLMEDGVEAYPVNKPFNIAGESWVITDIAADGSSITIDVSEEKVDPKVALRPGAEAPDIIAETISGDEFRLSDQKGKYVLIDFWGTWCGPCIDALPKIKEAYDIYGGEDFEIIGIAKEADADRFKEFVSEEGIRWPQIVELISGDEAVQELYSVNAYPTYYLVDPEGTIVEYGMALSEDNLVETLSKYLSN